MERDKIHRRIVSRELTMSKMSLQMLYRYLGGWDELRGFITE